MALDDLVQLVDVVQRQRTQRLIRLDPRDQSFIKEWAPVTVLVCQKDQIVNRLGLKLHRVVPVVQLCL